MCPQLTSCQFCLTLSLWARSRTLEPSAPKDCVCVSQLLEDSPTGPSHGEGALTKKASDSCLRPAVPERVLLVSTSKSNTEEANSGCSKHRHTHSPWIPFWVFIFLFFPLKTWVWTEQVFCTKGAAWIAASPAVCFYWCLHLVCPQCRGWASPIKTEAKKLTATLVTMFSLDGFHFSC